MNDFREQIEQELVKRIEVRVSSMKWRPNYEKWVQQRIWQERYRDRVLENLRRYVPDWERATILDLGSGMGGLMVRLQQEGCKILGLDYCFDYCIITKLRGMRYGLRPNVINGIAERIPLKDQSVDVIFCYEVIEHVFDPMAMLREIRRVIKPSGVVFITVPNRWSPYDHHYHMWGINFLPRPIAEWIIKALGRDKGSDTSAGVQKLSELHYFSFRAFYKLAKQVGFVLFDVREDKLMEGIVPPTRVGRLISMLKRLRLLHLVYRLYRFTLMDEWHFILKPAGESV
jgi:2-polyprenyl-3-methyl-5-hydroxy-6-metoxy-1,4-benzoquinol methylase